MASVSDAKQKVMPPAIALMVVGGLSILLGLYFAWSGLQARAGADKFQAEFDKGFKEGLKTPTNLSKEEKEQFEKMSKDMGAGLGGIVQGFGTSFLIGGLILLASGGLGIFGGYMMMTLKSYSMSMLGSVAIFPGCCCIGGLPVAVWALIVLNSPDVKAAFRAAGAPA